MAEIDSADPPLTSEQGDPAPLEAEAEQVLRRLRAEAAARVQSLREGLPAGPPGVMDPEDASIEDVTREMEATLAEMSTGTLRRIDEALQRLREGTYAVCAGCGQRVAEARLRAVPFAERCVACEEEHERDSRPSGHLRSLFDPEQAKPWQVTPTSASWFRSPVTGARVPGSIDGLP